MALLKTAALSSLVLISLGLKPGLSSAEEPPLGKMPVRQLSHWKSKGALAKPIEERVTSASPEMVEYLRRDNINQGVKTTPKAATLDASMLADLRAAVRELPFEVKRLVSPKLVSISIVTQLGGSGYTETISDDKDQPVAGFIVLDKESLDKKANAWITWKENTPFLPAGALRIDARIEPPAQDTRRSAYRYILLHELGHIASIGTTLTPSWNADALDPAPFEFSRISWTYDAERKRYVPRDFAKDFPEWDGLFYYDRGGGRKVSASMLPLYEQLTHTPFVNLYASTNPYDDFAESFATFVHTVLMKRPWDLKIMEGRDAVFALPACWGTARCLEKEKILRRLLFK